ncbi:MAG: hypothetical protein AAGM67_09425, partial [Bacteroidota bacterium]
MTRDENVRYVFEIDTTDFFNSPLKASSGVVQGSATFVSWEVPFTLQDSTVYFWRVRLNDVSPSVWGESSFKYIANRTGWAQAKLPQFENDASNSVRIDKLQRQWTFDDFGVEYETFTRRNGSFVYSINGSLEADLSLNGISQGGVAWAIIDQFTLQPIYRQANLGRAGFAAVPENLYQLRDAIGTMKTGDYIIVSSHFNPEVQLWPEDVFGSLAEVGASGNIRLLQDGDPFILMGRKGYPNSAIEVYSANSDDKLLINNVLLAPFAQGEINSPRIGPALSWDEMFWDWKTIDPLPEEDAQVSVFAVRQDGSDSLFLQNLPIGTYDLSGLDASRFPYLRLQANVQDSARRTPPQLDNWHVVYEEAGDAVVDPLTNFTFQSDSVYEGQDIFLHMAAKNISSVPLDSMDVLIILERSDRSRLVLDTLRIPPLNPNSPSIEFEYGFNTLGKELDGNTLLIVELNPDEEQPEQHFFNNLYVQPFYVFV